VEYTNTELLARGSMKLMGTMLWTLLDYPDRPYGWHHDPDVKRAFEAAKAELAETDPESAEEMTLPHTVGFWDKKGNRVFPDGPGQEPERGHRRQRHPA